MALNKTRYFGIKYPFLTDNEYGSILDLNNDDNERLNSEIAHLLLTQKGTRVRMPDFGTNLIHYIFDLGSDENFWNSIKEEIRDAVNKYIENVSLNDINVEESEDDDHSIYIDVRYTSTKGETEEDNRLVIKI